MQESLSANEIRKGCFYAATFLATHEAIQDTYDLRGFLPPLRGTPRRKAIG